MAVRSGPGGAVSSRSRARIDIDGLGRLSVGDGSRQEDGEERLEAKPEEDERGNVARTAHGGGEWAPEEKWTFGLRMCSSDNRHGLGPRGHYGLTDKCNSL